jgi:CrcB protein
MRMLLTGLGVAAFGGFASVIRLGLARWSGWLPWGILFANTAASFLAGIELLAESAPSPLIIAGICGGLSTFSTFAGNTVELARAKQYLRAVINMVANLVLPFTAAMAPLALAGALLN